jgi:hypothetical protein
MSYCGACGGFYNPACPNYPRCSPSPNPHDERTANLIAISAAVNAEVAGMRAENECRAIHGHSPAYGETQFFELAVALRKEIAK